MKLKYDLGEPRERYDKDGYSLIWRGYTLPYYYVHPGGGIEVRMDEMWERITEFEKPIKMHGWYHTCGGIGTGKLSSSTEVLYYNPPIAPQEAPEPEIVYGYGGQVRPIAEVEWYMELQNYQPGNW